MDTKKRADKDMDTGMGIDIDAGMYTDIDMDTDIKRFGYWIPVKNLIRYLT
jgi:hypothetical protein